MKTNSKAANQKFLMPKTRKRGLSRELKKPVVGPRQSKEGPAMSDQSFTTGFKFEPQGQSFSEYGESSYS